MKKSKLFSILLCGLLTVAFSPAVGVADEGEYADVTPTDAVIETANSQDEISADDTGVSLLADSEENNEVPDAENEITEDQNITEVIENVEQQNAAAEEETPAAEQQATAQENAEQAAAEVQPQNDSQTTNASARAADGTVTEGPFTIDASGTIIAFNKDMAASGDIVIPAEIGGIKVTAIGDNAFEIEDGEFITSVIIPDGVVSIGDRAFALNSNLTTVKFPETLKSIGSHAFGWTQELSIINLPNSLTDLGEGAFSKCYGLTTITLPDTLTTIGSGSFYYCPVMTSIYIPSSVTSIGSEAFARCESLESLTLPAGLKTLGDYVVARCESLKYIEFLGDAPTGGSLLDEPYEEIPGYNWHGLNPNYVTLYREGAQGFTNPWRGWPTMTVEEYNALHNNSSVAVISNVNANVSPAAVSTNGANNSLKAPKTGQDDFSLLLTLILAAAVAAVITSAVLLKRGQNA